MCGYGRRELDRGGKTLYKRLRIRDKSAERGMLAHTYINKTHYGDEIYWLGKRSVLCGMTSRGRWEGGMDGRICFSWFMILGVVNQNVGG